MIGRVLLLVSEYQKAKDMKNEYNKYSKFYKGKIIEKTETLDYVDSNSPLATYLRRGKALKKLDFQIAIELLMVDVINPLHTAGILVVASIKDPGTIDLCFYDEAPVIKTYMQTASNHIKQ